MTRARDLADSADKDISGTLTVDDLTASGDVSVGGNLSVSGTTTTIDSANAQTVDLGDNDKIRLGDGDDLQIYHDGSHSYIDDQGTGSLQIKATNLNIKSAANETYIACVADGQVELNYDNSTKLATTSTGVDVTGTVTATALTVSGAFASQGIDDNATSTAMTLDASGNVLVGKAGIGVGTDGFEARASGLISSSVTSGTPFYVNRNGSDGEIINIRKSDATVGRIGANSGSAFFTNSSTGGIRCGSLSGSTLLLPTDENGASEDAVHDLGYSTVRWRDLYLSGGAYLGGTAAANKLEDYEEGTWTPTVATGTATATNAWYVKVGKLIVVSCKLASFSDTTTGNSVIVGGVPYAAKTTDHTAQGSMIAAHFDGNTYFPYISSNTSSIFFYNQETSSSYTSLTHSSMSSSASFYFTLTYRTEA